MHSAEERERESREKVQTTKATQKEEIIVSRRRVA